MNADFKGAMRSIFGDKVDGARDLNKIANVVDQVIDQVISEDVIVDTLIFFQEKWLLEGFDLDRAALLLQGFGTTLDISQVIWFDGGPGQAGYHVTYPTAQQNQATFLGVVGAWDGEDKEKFAQAFGKCLAEAYPTI